MKALLCHEFGSTQNLSIGEIEKPLPKSNQVLIRVKACGINFPDTLIIQNKYQFKPELPFAPGGEISGTVKAVGTEVTHVKVGDQVFAQIGWGGLAEFALADSHKCYRVSKSVDPVTAATTMYTSATAYYALNQRGQLKPGETLLVLGAAGGIGSAAVQLGKLIGAKVIAAASTDEKLAQSKANGADETINYTMEDLKERCKALTNGKGVDVILDPVGDKYAEPSVRALAWGGKYLVVGFTGGAPSKIPMNLPLLKGASIVGVFWSAFAQKQPTENAQNFTQLIKWVENGQLKQPIHKSYSLAQGKQAIQDLVERKVIGKNVVLID
ncbi:NADPH:quinone oxidoreductase family protein [Roseivirga pacifica]|uniref:NADPH:quinone oxidoreductase family protein n=1 Tax=Roseivirga pacifica TaxID=1267423 RepID=UPI003BAAC0DE